MAQALFKPGETLQTARLVISAASAADVDSMPWLAAALRPDWEPEDLLAHVASGEAALICNRESRAIGAAVTVRDRPETGAACITLIAIDPGERFRGLGGEAALALERRAVERWGTRRLLAPVPEERGLAVYFWLRLGFRPLTQSEAPWPLVGLGGKAGQGVWLARDAADNA